jgi:hypothetical protein
VRELTLQPAQGNNSAVRRNAQAPLIPFRPVTPDEVRGARFGLVRRLIGAFEGRDLPPPAFAARLKKDKKQVYRWERGEDKPREDTVDKIVEMCVAAGLPTITAEWLERGRGSVAALGELRVPDSALAPAAAADEPVHVTPVVKKTKPAPRGAPAVSSRKSSGGR